MTVYYLLDYNRFQFVLPDGVLVSKWVDKNKRDSYISHLESRSFTVYTV